MQLVSERSEVSTQARDDTPGSPPRSGSRLTNSGLFGPVLRGAGAAFVVRVLGFVAAYVSQILLARWMGVQEYGAYVVGRSGRPKIYVEHSLTAKWKGVMRAGTPSPLSI